MPLRVAVEHDRVEITNSGDSDVKVEGAGCVGFLDGFDIGHGGGLVWCGDCFRGIGGTVMGNDILLAQISITSADSDHLGSGWAYFSGYDFDDGGLAPAGGYIYARIFEDNTVEPGDWWYTGAVVAAQDLDPNNQPLDVPQLYDINRESTNGDLWHVYNST